jgi:hypothetical protein
MIDKLINIWNLIPVEKKNAILIIGGLIIFVILMGWLSSRKYKNWQ